MNQTQGTDLALLKLMHPPTNKSEIISICLPESGIINEKRELAMNAGRGTLSEENVLQVGYKMLMTRDDVISNFPNETEKIIEVMKERLFTIRVDNRSLSCKVSLFCN